MTIKSNARTDIVAGITSQVFAVLNAHVPYKVRDMLDVDMPTSDIDDTTIVSHVSAI